MCCASAPLLLVSIVLPILLLAPAFAGDADSSPCRVLSLSGGGSYGAFEAGVLKRLVENDPNLDYDFITGVSAGAMNAGFLGLYPSGNLSTGIRDLEGKWLDITQNSEVYKKIPFNIARDKSVYDTAPLRSTVTRFIAGRHVVRPILLGVTNIATGTQDQLDEHAADADLVSAVMASSAIPIVFPPITFNNTLYSDGGTTADSIVLQGISRCSPHAPVSVDILVCDPTLSELSQSQTKKLGFVNLAIRTAEIVIKSWSTNFLRFKCSSEQTSRISARLFSPAGTDQGWSALDFTHAPEIMESGYKRPVIQEFSFCP